MSDSPLKDLPAKRTLRVWRKHGLKLLSVGVALIAFTVALFIHNSAKEALFVAKSSLQQQQTSNLEAAQSAELLNQYLMPYRTLQEQGVIAQPARLQWLEALQASVNHNLVPIINFTLLPTAPASVTNTIYLHEILAVKVTPLRVDYTLLHEGDLYRLLKDMQSQSKGLFSAESCEIKRSEEPLGDPQTEAQSLAVQDVFKGYCDLLWYSLADITGAWEVKSEP
jgi:hypothetical protein